MLLGFVAEQVATQYLATQLKPSHGINNLSFFDLKREFVSFFV